MFASRPHRLARSASRRPLLMAARTSVLLAASLAVTLLGLAAPRRARAQGQTTITLTPSSRVVFGADTSLVVTVTWCGYPPQLFDIETRSIQVNGVDVTASFDLQWDPHACGFTGNISDEQFYKSTGTIVVSSPESFVSADVWDWSRTWLWSAPPQTYKRPDPRRRIVVVADAQFQEVRPSAGQAQRFTLYNSGPVRDTFDVSRTCTGTTSGCTLSTASVALDAGQSTAVTASFTSGAVGATGTITLRAWRTADPTFADSSWTDVAVTAGPPTGVTIVGTAPGVGDVVRRGLCVAVAAGAGAAAECGDLRLVHTLPSVRTLGSARTPTLIYNSQHARPKPLVVANVTLPTTGPSGSLLPTTVEGRIYIGGVQRGFASWLGSDWGSLGSTRRVVVPGDDQTWTQGRSDITVEMKYIWPNASVTYASQAGALVVVNRAGSPFGAGWWLAGLEQLYWLGTQRMVIGGDGSVRVYNPVGTNLYVSADPEHPDTLDGTGADYVRKAPDGLRVLFNATTGRQIATINRLDYRTDFYWNGGTGPLDSLKVPTLGSPLTYTFSYSGNLLSAVTAPGGRQVTVYISNAKVDSIQDPDGSRVRFTYGSGVNQYRVATRKDRRGKVTTFGWNDGAQRLTQVQRPLSITTTFAFAETQGLSTAVPVDSAYTLIDGPRSDVADVTKLWVNGHGAPTRIRNAVGRETLIAYDAAWPGLAAVTKGPSGLRSRRVFNARGLPVTDTVINPLGTGQNAVTQYTWHATWDAVTQITSPTGLVTTFGYDGTSGNRLWEQRGTDPARRVNYSYDATTKLLTAVTEPALPPETYAYSLLGNLSLSRSPLGFVTLICGDAIGRDTLVISPRGTGAQATDTNQVQATGLRQSTSYDAMDRVIRTISVGPATTLPNGRTVPADTVRLENAYDSAGNLRGATRYYSSNAFGAGPLWAMTPSEWEYDDLDRVSRQHETGAGWTTYTRDGAGNATSVLTPRGYTLTAQFDALNRVTRRVLPQVSFVPSYCHAYGGCVYTFPTRDGPDLTIGVDTLWFDYDAAGNLRRADNNWAWVRRAYTPSGLLASDTLYTRTYETSAPYPGGSGDRHGGALVSSDFTTSHVYALRYSYDLDGRRRELHHPAPIAPCAGACLQRYGYHSMSGTLDTVVDPLGRVTWFAYDNAGRLVTSTSPGGAAIASSYDADSRSTRRLGLLTSDTLNYDATNRVVTGSVYMPGAGDRAIELAYTGLGALNWSAGITGGSGFEDFATDALGNRTWLRDQGIGDYGDRTRYWSYDNGQLTHGVLGTGPCGNPGVSMSSCHPAWYRFEHNASYDASGNNDATWGDDTQGSDAQTALLLNDESRSYYGPDEKLMVRNRHLGLGTGSYPGGVFEEYRYDALGRRVFVRSRRTSSCAQAPGYHYQCGSYVQRTVWDGDQVLYEIRGGGSDSLDVWFLEDDGGGLPATEPHMFGRAVYTHALGIDQPVGILRLDAGSWTFLAPHANWRGSYTYGTLASGAVCPGAGECPLVPWPADLRTADGGSTSTAPTEYTAWYGNLITAQADGSGLQYRRNRYYDPATGRFTQQDPIGLAGGLNLYGFAGGDPVNSSDPFGLTVTCTYEQRTGRMVCVDDGTGRTVVNAVGYAGTGAGRNNPAMQQVGFVGPLPQGVYAISDAGTYNDMPVTLRLTRAPGHPKIDRDGFLIHADNSITHDASLGCIVLPRRADRETIRDAGGGTLTVVSGEREPATISKGWLAEPLRVLPKQ